MIDLAIIIVIAIGFFVFVHIHDEPKLKTADKTYQLLVAKTTAQQTKGLGGRASLPANQAMIFVFPSEGTQCMWMKGMRFPLDVVWTNAQRQVVATQSNISPKTYPKEYCPSKPAEYMIELNSGQIKAAGIKIGQTLSF